MKLYHVSNYNSPFISEFVPRIPDCRARIGEDDTIPRVATCTTFSECISAFPEGGSTFSEIFWDDDNDKYELLVLYEFDVDEDDVIAPEELYRRGLVNDAIYTNEYWVTKTITPSVVYEVRVESFNEAYYPGVIYSDLEKYADDNGEFLYLGKSYDYDEIYDNADGEITMLEDVKWVVESMTVIIK